MNGDTGDVADDNYHRYEADLDLLSETGLGAYRFSISWSRIFPTGSVFINHDGFDFYDRLADAILKKGLVPFCTIYHWDLPQYLQDKGGWENTDTASRFADYASHVARHLGDRIPFFVTLNEIRSFIGFGYRDGRYAPGLRLSRKRVAQARNNGLLAHGLGLHAIRAAAPKGVRVGVAENPVATVPLSADDRDVKAAAAAFREENAPFLTALWRGLIPMRMSTVSEPTPHMSVRTTWS